MEFYHVTEEMRDRIYSAGKAVGALETGRRNAIRAEEAFIQKAFRSNGRYCKTRPQQYRILYTYGENLGTRKYPDYIRSVSEIKVENPSDIHETEKFLVFKKNIRIAKDYILCFVW